jgi:hypothetical protein
MLQRRFRIGYNRAARLVEMLEARGIVGPADGARPRSVLLTEEEFFRMKSASHPSPSSESTAQAANTPPSAPTRYGAGGEGNDNFDDDDEENETEL